MTSSVRATGFVDPGWEHGVAQDERKKKVRCNYCGKIVSGGIYRLKQHLARISGEVTYCDKAPDEVYLKMKENLGGSRLVRKPRQIEYEEQAHQSLQSNDDDMDEEEDEQTGGYKGKGKQLMDNRGGFVINLTPLRSLGYVDPGWDHGVAQDERKKKVKCNYCEKIVSGGINRFKQHIARIPGEVAPCKNAPEEVYLKIKENMKWHRTGRRQRRPDAKEISAFYVQSDEEEEEEEGEAEEERLVISNQRLGRNFREMPSSSGSETLPKRPRIDSLMLATTSKSPEPVSYRQMKTRSSKKSRKEAMSSISKFFYYAGVPSHVANSPYFRKMIELIGHYGPDLAGPSSHMLSGRCLRDEVSTIKYYFNEYKASWAATGCSILADSWRDTQDRTLINFLVSCPRSIYFISSVDASNFCEDSASLFKLLDKVVEEMGEENVIQVITENTASYQAAGKMLEEKRKNLFWTPCTTYCTDRILEDFQKIKLVGECIEKAQKITKLIYNQIGLLNFVKKEITGGQELLVPSISQQASNFATLHNLLDQRIGLKRMLQSDMWISSWYSKSDEGKEVEKIIINATFWKKMQYVKRSVDPILEVLQKVNGDENLSMPYIYHDMHRAKLEIKANHGDDPCKYESFWNVIDNHWSSLFRHPLYLAAYFLNPSYRYRPDFVAHPEVVRGLNSCLVRLEPDNGRRISASLQISDFGFAKADFGTDLALSTRSELNPAAWWQQHGINCLELQRIAVRILSQTCSSFGCEHTWSIHDQIHSQKQNRVARKRLNDLIYVHYNLRLGERQMRRNSNESIPLESVWQESLLCDWTVDAQKQELSEDKKIIFNEMVQEDRYENELIEYEGGKAEARKKSSEMVTLTDVGPLDVDPLNNFGTTSDGDGDEDEGADLDFLDDEQRE